MRYLITLLLVGILFFHSINIFAIEVDRNEFVVDGCIDPLACNFDPLADTDDGSCSYDDADGDGVCDDDEILGCTISVACNYNPDATEDDDSCEFESCAGCTNPEACNFDYTATTEDGSCEYPETYYNCDGSCVIDTDGDGVCDIYEIEGCATPFACNYDPEATDDDGSCDYGELGELSFHNLNLQAQTLDVHLNCEYEVQLYCFFELD